MRRERSRFFVRPCHTWVVLRLTSHDAGMLQMLECLDGVLLLKTCYKALCSYSQVACSPYSALWVYALCLLYGFFKWSSALWVFSIHLYCTKQRIRVVYRTVINNEVIWHNQPGSCYYTHVMKVQHYL